MRWLNVAPPHCSHVVAEQGAQQRRRNDVEMQHRGGAGGVGVDSLAKEKAAGVVDEDVDHQAEARDNGMELGGGLGPGEVHSDGAYGHVVLPTDLRGGGAEGVPPLADQDERVATRGETLGDGSSDARAAPCHEGHTVRVVGVRRTHTPTVHEITRRLVLIQAASWAWGLWRRLAVARSTRTYER